MPLIYTGNRTFSLDSEEKKTHKRVNLEHHNFLEKKHRVGRW
jgi:hypothetical protein